MLGHREKTTPANANNINVLSQGTSMEGDLKSQGDLRIDGEVKGNVTTEGKCIVGITGKITGTIKAKDCDISGQVKGDIHTNELLLIKNSGNVHGDIYTSKLVLENGGEFNGACCMGSAISINKENITLNAKQAEG